MAKFNYTTELFIFVKINNKNGNRRINRRIQAIDPGTAA